MTGSTQNMQWKCSLVIASGQSADSTLLDEKQDTGMVDLTMTTFVQRQIATVVRHVKRSQVNLPEHGKNIDRSLGLACNMDR